MDEFYAHPRMSDGRLNKCKDCTKRDVKTRETTLKTTSLDWLAAERERCRNKQAIRRALGLAKYDSQKSHKEWKLRNPQKRSAHNAINNGVRTGAISKPDRCERCHQQAPLHGHHPDYNKPKDVQWLCPKCHGLAHRKPVELLKL